MPRPKKAETVKTAENAGNPAAENAENAAVQAPKRRGRPPKDPALKAEKPAAKKKPAKAVKPVARISREFLKEVKADQDQRIKANKEAKAKAKAELQKKETDKWPVKTEETKAKIAARNQKIKETINAKPKEFGKVTKKPKDINLELVMQCAKLGMTQAETASYVGLCAASFYSRMAKDPALQEAWEIGRSQGVFKAASALMAQIEDNQFPAIKFYLSCRANWSEKNEVNVNGSIEHQINLKEMTDDQLLKLVGDEAGELD
jgi:hypothetical protein